VTTFAPLPAGSKFAATGGSVFSLPDADKQYSLPECVTHNTVCAPAASECTASPAIPSVGAVYAPAAIETPCRSSRYTAPVAVATASALPSAAHASCHWPNSRSVVSGSDQVGAPSSPSKLLDRERKNRPSMLRSATCSASGEAASEYGGRESRQCATAPGREKRPRHRPSGPQVKKDDARLREPTHRER
jgi:hypothetical protein